MIFRARILLNVLEFYLDDKVTFTYITQEDDDRLGYEIRDFQMKEGHAVFTVYNVPIESSTLSQVGQQQSGSSSGSSSSLPDHPMSNTTSVSGTTSSKRSSDTNTVN